MDDPDAASLLPPCRGVTQSGIVVSRIWGGNSLFAPGVPAMGTPFFLR